MDFYDRELPSRPYAAEDGIGIDLTVNGQRRAILVTREAFDRALPPAPSHITPDNKSRTWLAVVQHNVEVVRAAAERRLAEQPQLVDPIRLGPDDIAGRF